MDHGDWPPFGFESAVTLKFAVDGAFSGLGTPPTTPLVGGEVDNWDTNTALMRHSNWPGSWVFSSVTDQPQPGNDIKTELGRAVGTANGYINPVDMIAFLGSSF
jgi:hypothetical protein